MEDTIAIISLITGATSWAASFVLLILGYETAGFISVGVGAVALFVLWVACEISTMGDGKGDAWLRDD